MPIALSDVSLPRWSPEIEYGAVAYNMLENKERGFFFSYLANDSNISDQKSAFLQIFIPEVADGDGIRNSHPWVKVKIWRWPGDGPEMGRWEIQQPKPDICSSREM